MTISNSVAVRNAKLDAEETTIGTAPYLRVYSGTVPAGGVGASLGAAVLIAEGILPSDWMANAASGIKAKSGTWAVTGAVGAGASPGSAGTFFRIYASDGTTPHKQGTFGASGTDMTVDNNAIATGQVVNVNTFTETAGNA